MARVRRAAPRLLAVAVAVATLAFLAPMATAAPEPQRLPAELSRAITAYHQATVRKDTKALAALVTDDYLLVNSDASLQDKASYLADFEAPGFVLDPYETELPSYWVRGDAALTAWTFKLSWIQDGLRQNRRLRMAHFWVREGGRWRIAHTQLTRIPD